MSNWTLGLMEWFVGIVFAINGLASAAHGDLLLAGASAGLTALLMASGGRLISSER